jgi:molecular chaperone DnaK (HSP70)
MKGWHLTLSFLQWQLLQVPVNVLAFHLNKPQLARRSPTFAAYASAAANEGIGVGIDLGTTYSAIAILENGLPTIVPIPNNGRTMPSVVTLLHDTALVGREAMAVEAQQGSYRNVKRILGRGAAAAQDSRDVVPFLRLTGNTDERGSSAGKNKRYIKKKPTLSKQLQDANDDPAMLQLPFDKDASIPPTEISAHILRKLLHTAEQYTNQQVTRAVIGVPAYFHDAQREATIQAAKLAGLETVKLLREPEAAALAYGMGKQQVVTQRDNDEDVDELVLVFDLGGGTYDVSMLVVGGGITEIITTSGNSQLGGSDFDAKVAQHLKQILAKHALALDKTKRNDNTFSSLATDAILRSAELVRIYLSNNRKVKLALPLRKEDWSHMNHASDIILPLEFDLPSAEGIFQSNGTHVLCELTRREMEKLCQDEFLALLRPIREVAIMAGALLPGDTSPTIVEAAMQMEEEQSDSLVFEDFYKPDVHNSDHDHNNHNVDEAILLQLNDAITVKEQKKAQQRGRQKARDVTKRERKYRQEKRKLSEQLTSTADASDVKVRDGISGRPISRVVLVGGATRMPAIGRLLSALTGVVPQKTVNPDEAVALGCAVHVGVLDGNEDMGTVLSPMQAAILRAVAEQQRRQGLSHGDTEEDEEFDTLEHF